MMHTDLEFGYLPGGVMTDGAAVVVPPKVTGIAVAPGADQKLAVLRWNPAPANADIAGYEILLSNGKTVKAKTNSVSLKKLDAGRQTVTVVAVDKAKNRSDGVRFTFNVADITAPKTGKVTAVQAAADKVRLDLTGFSDNVGIKKYRIYLDGKLVGTTATTSFTYRKANLAGKLAFTVTAVDAAGNESKPGKVNVAIKDVTAPDKVKGIKAAPGANQNLAVLNWQAASDNVGVTAYEVQIAGGKKFTTKTNSITLKKLAGGATTVTVYALDKDKNRSAGTNYTFTVADGTAPKTGKVTAVQIAADKVRLDLTGFSDDVGIKKYRIYLDGRLVGTTATTSFTYRKANLAGKLAFTVTALDAAGNESKPAKANVTIKDVTPPDKVTGVKAEISGQTAVIRWNPATDNVGVASYDVVIDGKHYSAKTNSYILKKIADGATYKVTVAAVDKAKNVGRASDVVTFGKVVPPRDTTPPGKVTGVKAVLSGANATISWNAATDNVGVTSYEIMVNGTKYTSTATSLTVRNLKAGTNYEATVRALDAAGNAGAASEVCSFRYSSSTPVTSATNVRLHSNGVVVSSAASMSGKTVASNWLLVAEKGGAVANTVVNGGTLLVSSGGSATGTVISAGQGSAVSAAMQTVTMKKGYLTVLQGGVANNVTVSGGTLRVFSGGAVNSTIISAGQASAANGSMQTVTMKDGYLTVLDGGVVRGVIVSGGKLIARTSGSALNVNVLSGSVDVSSGGVVQSTMVESGVYFRAGAQGSGLATVLNFGAHGVVSSGGLMSGGTVSKGAGLTVSKGGVVRNMQVLAGGSAYVSNGATVSDLKLVGNYVKMQLGIDSATNVHFVSSGLAHTVSNGVLNDVTAHLYTYFEVSAGGLVRNIRLGDATTSKGGAVEVFSGGRAETIANHNYGQVNVFAGGFLSGASTDTEGEIYLYGGSAAALQADRKGYIWVHSGSVASKVTVTSAGELTISSGGSAAGVTVQSKGHAMVEERNGFMTNVDIQSGGKVEVCGGNASGVTVRKGGLLTFSSGFEIMDGPWKQSLNGQASNVVLSGGTLVARYTGSAAQVTALSGAEIQVSSASMVKGLTLSSGTYMVVNSAGKMNGADILSGAQLDLTPGATAADVRISSGAVVNLSFSGGMTVNGWVCGREFIGNGGLLTDYTQNLGVLALKAGTTVSSLQVSSGGRVNLESGASANRLTVGTGAVAYLYDAAWDVQAVGETHLMAGGRMTSAAVTGGYTHLHSGASASEVEVSDSGRLLVSAGATVTGLAVATGGQTAIYQGAQVSSAAVTGGYANLFSGATASGVEVSDSGRLLVSGGATVTGLAVSSGGQAVLYQGAQASSATVSSGGTMHISSGATVSRLAVSAGGKCYVSGNVQEAWTYTDLHVFGGGVISGAAVSAGYLHISSGAVGNYVQVESSARVMVYGGATVNALGINEGGNAVASSGAVINGLQTMGSAYVLTLRSGAMLTGDIDLNEGRVMVEEGAVVKWDIAQSAPNDIALIRGLEFINGRSFTIAVSSSQKSGTYTLGRYNGSGKTFDCDVTVTVDGVSIGTVNPASPGGGTISAGELNLELQQTEGIVSLEVSHLGSLSSPCSDASALWRPDNAVDLGAFAAPENESLLTRRDESALGTMLAAFGN